MRRKKRVIEQVVNKASTISDRVGLNIKVHFHAAESEDIVDGVPDLKFSFGNHLRLGDKGNSKITAFAHFRTVQVLAGGEIRTTTEPRQRSSTIEDRFLSCLPAEVASGRFELFPRLANRLTHSVDKARKGKVNDTARL